jgi:hypothetical protein
VGFVADESVDATTRVEILKVVFDIKGSNPFFFFRSVGVSFATLEGDSCPAQ